MASAIVKSGVRAALRSGSGCGGGLRAAPAKRSFSSSSSVHEEAREAAKWEKITYLGAATCTGLAVYHLSGGHPHFEEPPAYSYLHIRNKEFPWGPNGLFEVKDH
ncbi:hypothetical protein QQ045_010652 [Rhodiola kirilowii]